MPMASQPHMCQDIGMMRNPGASALFHAPAEALPGLRSAFANFETRSEKAWS